MCANKSVIKKSFVFRKAAAVEDQKKLAAFFQSLNRMRDGRWKIPEVAHADIVDEVASLFVDGRNAGAPGEHVGPFRLFMPMHFANRAGLEPHVDARELGRDRQFAHRDLAGPASVKKPIMCGGEREFEIGNRAGIRIRRRQLIGIFALERNIAGPEDCCPPIVLDRLRIVLACCLCHHWVLLT
jgi:hypothetical protein